jgi:two-component system, LytTR family, response regulator
MVMHREQPFKYLYLSNGFYIFVSSFMINAVIIEDELNSRNVLQHLLKKNCPNIHIAGIGTNVKEGIQVVQKFKPELVFLDITMPDGSGFDVIEQLCPNGTLSSDLFFDIIFTTAFEKFAIKAIKYSALDYLLKPIDSAELKIAVKKVEERRKNSARQNVSSILEYIKQGDEPFSKITLPTGNAYEVVQIKDIVRCEAYDNYTYVYMANGKKYLVSGTLKHYEEQLPSKDFIRTHHSHLINISHIVRYSKEDGGHTVMSDGSKVDVSRRKKEDFLVRFKNYLGNNPASK